MSFEASTAQIASMRLQDGPVVVATMRNEVERAPRWLEHHRSIGVRNFVLLDNA